MTLVNDEELEKMMNSETLLSDSNSSVISVPKEEVPMESNDIQQQPAASPAKKGRPSQGLIMDITQLSPELLSAYKIVTQLMSTSNKSVNNAFMNPMDLNNPEYHNYNNVVKKPMWLNKVKLKLLSRRYHTISQVIRDLRLVLENCYRYFGPAHHVTKKAIKLETMLEQKLALLPRELKEKTSLQLTTPELVTRVENKTKASTSKTTANLGSHKDETSLILSCVRQAKAKQEREARRLQMEEKRAERDTSQHELIKWEESFYGKDLDLVKKMWEVPQIGHFLYLVQTVLNIPEVSQFELERAFLTPQCSSLLASIMTSLLSSPHLRSKLDEIPSMTYKIWQNRLKLKVQNWYKIYHYRGRCPVKVFETAGIEPMFFTILGPNNLLENKQFHELDLRQRVWLVKSMCDHCLQNHKSIQEAIFESSYLDQKEYFLGKDKAQSIYIHFPQFCGQSLRVYKQYFDVGEPPDLSCPLPVWPPPSSTDDAAALKEDENGSVLLNQTNDVDKKETTDSKAEEEDSQEEKDTKAVTPVSKRRKPRRGTSWSTTRRRRVKKKVVEVEEEVKDEEPRPNITPFFELIVDNIESLRQLATKFSGRDPLSSAPATPLTSAPATPSSQVTSSPAPSPNPEEMLLGTPTSSRSTRRSKLLATIALRKASAATTPVKKEKDSDVEDDEANTNQCVDEKNLHKRLKNLLKELEPWEQKLDQADRKMRYKLKKEWEDFFIKGTTNDAEAANEYWGAIKEEEVNVQELIKLDEESSSSSDSFYINAEKELASMTQLAKEENTTTVEEPTPAQGSIFRKTHYRHCTKRQKVTRNLETGTISSSSDFDEDSEESSGSSENFQITVSSRGRIRKTKNLGFNFENVGEMKTSKAPNEPLNNRNGIILDDAKQQYQWETMRQLLVENSPKEAGTSKIGFINAKKAVEGASGSSSPHQPILENLLASQPGFGLMKGQEPSGDSQEVEGNLPNEPKYMKSFIQKHYQAPSLPKQLSPLKKATVSSANPITKQLTVRQSKDGGRKIIETTFSKPGVMKTTVSTNHESVRTPPAETPVPQKTRQPCYANAHMKTVTTTTTQQQRVLPNIIISSKSGLHSIVNKFAEKGQSVQLVSSSQLSQVPPKAAQATIQPRAVPQQSSQIRIVQKIVSRNNLVTQQPPSQPATPLKILTSNPLEIATVNSTQQQLMKPVSTPGSASTSELVEMQPKINTVMTTSQPSINVPSNAQQGGVERTHNFLQIQPKLPVVTDAPVALHQQFNTPSQGTTSQAVTLRDTSQGSSVSTIPAAAGANMASQPRIAATSLATNSSPIQSISGLPSGPTRFVIMRQKGQATQQGPKLFLKLVTTKSNQGNSSIQTINSAGNIFPKIKLIRPPNNAQNVTVSTPSGAQRQQKFIISTSNNIPTASQTIFQSSPVNVQNANQSIFQNNPTVVQFSNSQENHLLNQINVPQVTGPIMTSVVGNNCNTIPLQAQPSQINQSIMQQEINLNQPQLVTCINNTNLGQQMNAMGTQQPLGAQHIVNHQILTNTSDELPNLTSLNHQPIMNVVPNPATTQMNAMIVPCPIQIQSPNHIQYVTQQMITQTTPSTPIMQQTSQQVLVCSSSNANPLNTSLFDTNRNINTGNVYFMTSSGQLVTFSNNSTPTTNTLPSVPQNSLLNDGLSHL